MCTTSHRTGGQTRYKADQHRSSATQTNHRYMVFRWHGNDGYSDFGHSVFHPLESAHLMRTPLLRTRHAQADSQLDSSKMPIQAPWIVHCNDNLECCTKPCLQGNHSFWNRSTGPISLVAPLSTHSPRRQNHCTSPAPSTVSPQPHICKTFEQHHPNF